ncbi:MAG: AsmA family protein [Bosea sp. (in: a-proteobacteria)]
MKMRLPFSFLLLSLLVLAAGFWTWTLPSSRIEPRLTGGLWRATGLTFGFSGPVRMQLLPTPKLKFSQVSFAHADGRLSAKAPDMTASVRLLALVAGRLDFSSITLSSPEVDAGVPSEATTPAAWVAPVARLFAGLDGSARIIITNGTVFARAGTAISTIVRNVNIVLAERDKDEPLELAGSLVWRGEPTTLEVMWPTSAASNKTTFKIRSELLRSAFDGKLIPGEGPLRLDGNLEFETPALSRLVSWFGETAPLASLVGQMKLTANASLRGSVLELTSTAVQLDRDRLEGALSVRMSDGRWNLSGTFAGATLDIDRMMSAIDPRSAPGVDRNADFAINLDDWTRHDVDLRISIENARLAGLRLNAVAAQLMASSGRVEANIIRASAYKGSLRTRAVLSKPATLTEFRLQTIVERLDLAQASGDFGGTKRLSGTASGQFSVEGAGLSLNEVLASLSGRASANIRNGEMPGLALAEVVRRSERQPLSALRDWRSGRTGFDVANFTANISNGTVQLTDANMFGSSFRATLTGSATLAERRLALAGRLNATTGNLQIPFDITGPLADPVITPDLSALLSGQAPAAPARAIP